MKTIRTTLVFRFDETTITEETIKERLNALLMDAFPGREIKVHTHWLSAPAEGPFLGTAHSEPKPPTDPSGSTDAG